MLFCFVIILVIALILHVFLFSKQENFNVNQSNNYNYKKYPHVEYIDWEYGRRMFDSLTYDFDFNSTCY